MKKHGNIILLGIDIGSTTTKIAAVSAADKRLLYADYRRHNAQQLASVETLLREFAGEFQGADVRICLTGSGAKPLAEGIGLPFVQEVVANSIAICQLYQKAGTAIELGGQDAKIIFFREGDKDDQLQVADMRMNGSCAGGTGAFIDEIASVLRVPVEEFDALAAQGTCVYDISGRCGVYAKTDIQPLLNQGAAKADIALSAFHAIAKQTIGGLAQGLDIHKPVVLEGGPLTFNKTLIRVFKERLELTDEDLILPAHPQLMIAYGAALALLSIYGENTDHDLVEALIERLSNYRQTARTGEESSDGRMFFDSAEERALFYKRHPAPEYMEPELQKGQVVNAYLGIDSGSTTTKFVLLDENEQLLDSFYASNQGNPLLVARDALLALRNRYKEAGARLNIIAAGTTGYGEQLFANAFDTECHVVETVAHARAAARYVPDVSFILDIGGQDMKAIWIDNGIVTNIVVNEACSSGCGSFLENFAASLHMKVQEIAPAAFSSAHPAALGSRCTVFMNSSVITEQRNGKQPADIMAGLCRSVIENVFTKVIRISNVESLGSRIVVQGGTFRNDAVLRALEQYLGKTVVRAPYPEMMGAIGAALITKERFHKETDQATFIGLDALEQFSYEQQSNAPCPFCTNHCKRTILQFSNGKTWITNNRCERGEVLGDPGDAQVRALLKERQARKDAVPNLFHTRERLLLKEYQVTPLMADQGITIGLPRVLSYWETMPFWTTFYRALGYRVQLSDKSTRQLYEDGLSAVTSDTVCFPAKLVHGHIRNLASKHVDRIFMPSITTMPSENPQSTSVSMCAVVKGYPMVVRNSDNPEKRYGIPFDTPLFHWYTTRDRDRQLTSYMEEQFHIGKETVREAIQQADAAMRQFHDELQAAGRAVMEEVERTGRYAIVLASRPYQNDALVNHELPEMFTRLGLPVLTADAVPGVHDVDLGHSRLDVVNNFHARMLASAVIAAENPHLEYVQLVSFGCGHDAYLSDEIIRMMKEISGKTPLILKVDESDIQGPLGIRVRSFVETTSSKRRLPQQAAQEVRSLADPYPVKFTKEDRGKRVVLVPNTSHAFCRIMSAALRTQGIQAEPLAVGREEAIRLGKQYVHNDICFPAQIVIGEALAALRSGKYDGCQVAIGMGKYVGDCRLTHYSALLRKALDDAGYADVPVLTNDEADTHDLHPGFRMNILSAMRIAFALPMIDALEELLRKIRPYELVAGSTDAAFEAAMDELVQGLTEHGISGAEHGFARGIEIMKGVSYDRSRPRPRVLIVGEYLLNFHPGANRDIEAYLERNGFEIIEARMTDVIRKTYFYQDMQIKEYHLQKPIDQKAWYWTADHVFNLAHHVTDEIASSHPLYERATRIQELARESDPIIHHTFDAGEGILIPGEIMHHASKGCRAFVILQPFGCIPNHVVGRGISKRLKEFYPDVQILPLDYDPDISPANIENRLQMLIMNAKDTEASAEQGHAEGAGDHKRARKVAYGY